MLPSKHQIGVNSQFQPRVLSLKAFTNSPARLLAPVLPPLLPPSLMLLCSREETLKNSPASKKAPPAASVTGQARSQAWHNCTKKALSIFPSQTLKSTSTKQNTFPRSGAYPDLKKPTLLSTASQQHLQPETHRLTCIMGWEPPLCTGSLSQSLPPQRHHRARLCSHHGLAEKQQTLYNLCIVWQCSM